MVSPPDRPVRGNRCGELVPPAGFEPAISTLKGWRPRPLDDGGAAKRRAFYSWTVRGTMERTSAGGASGGRHHQRDRGHREGPHRTQPGEPTDDREEKCPPAPGSGRGPPDPVHTPQRDQRERGAQCDEAPRHERDLVVL